MRAKSAPSGSTPTTRDRRMTGRAAPLPRLFVIAGHSPSKTGYDRAGMAMPVRRDTYGGHPGGRDRRLTYWGAAMKNTIRIANNE